MEKKQIPRQARNIIKALVSTPPISGLDFWYPHKYRNSYDGSQRRFRRGAELGF